MRTTRGVTVVLLSIVSLSLSATSVLARDKSFSTVLNGLERDYDVKPKHLPGMWLAKLVVKVAHPRGVSKLDFALFENDKLRELTSLPEFEGRIHTMLGADWKPFVQVDNSKQKERITMFARPTHRHLDIFILSVETREAVALFARVNPQSLQHLIDDPSQSFVSR